MALTKVDVLNKIFSRSFRGYSCVEVDSFLRDIAEFLGAQAEDRVRLEAHATALETTLKEYKGREETLRDTLVTTQKMSEEMKTTAQKEAQLIIDAAHAKGESLLNQAHARLAQLHGEIAEVKKQRTQLEVKLQSTLEAHLRLLEQDREEHKKMDEAEQKLKFMPKTAS